MYSAIFVNIIEHFIYVPKNNIDDPQLEVLQQQLDLPKNLNKKVFYVCNWFFTLFLVISLFLFFIGYAANKYNVSISYYIFSASFLFIAFSILLFGMKYHIIDIKESAKL